MRILSNLDFTLHKYEELCRTIARSKYACLRLVDYLQLAHKHGDKPYIIMRHDIDRVPRRALDIAQAEHSYGIRATYYFRDRKDTYVTGIMDRVASFGHEIGYHYETIDKCKGNIEMARTLFKKELANFRARYEVKTVCAHGNPLTSYDNKDIWESAELSDFGLLGEAFLSLDYSRFAYFSDSGRTWLNSKSQKMPGKDFVETAFNDMHPESTDDVIEIIRGGKLPNICILTHPERWTGDIIQFSRRYLLDLAFSWGKVAISTYRRVGKWPI